MTWELSKLVSYIDFFKILLETSLFSMSVQLFKLSWQIYSKRAFLSVKHESPILVDIKSAINLNV